MNKNAKLLLVMLSITFLVIPMGIAASIPGQRSTDTMIPADEYNFSNRRNPINILMYTENADMDQEYMNVYESILGTYGDAFEYDHLNDYTQLASKVHDFDIFIILEQEVNGENFTTIGSSWADVLTDYVVDGGIVISLDGGILVADFGARILNATGLIETHNPEQIDPDTVTLEEPFDPLAFGSGASFATTNAAFACDVTNAVAVFEHLATSKAFVAHRQLGMGHIVYIGHDFYTRSAPVDLILTNAIRLTRLAVFDYTHNQQTTPIGAMSNFATALTTKGFAIQTMDVWNPALISRCDVFIIGNTLSTPDPYNTTEIDTLDDFVAGGGGLFLMTDYWNYGNTSDPLLHRFGYERHYASVFFADSDDNEGNANQPTFDSDNIANHSTTLGIDELQFFGPTAFDVIPEGATPIIWSDSDGTATWGGGDNASGLALAAVSHHGNGRIFAISDGDWTHNEYFSDLDDYYLAVSAAIWLSAAGIPEQTVIFDQSHTPIWTIDFGMMIDCAWFLTYNGFNIRWTYHFPEELLYETDVLVIVDGATNHTGDEIAAIVEYVAHGGSLFLMSDWGVYGRENSLIGLEFGLVFNTTAYLTDLDDTIFGDSYNIYNESNFANHPIMHGVSRIELDRGGGFVSVGSGTALIRTDNDGTTSWIYGGSADNVPVFAAKEYNMGRVVCTSDINFFGINDAETDGYSSLHDSSNDIFTANAFYWLIENRAPSVEVITPNGGEVLNGTIMVEWDALDYDSDPLTFDVLYSDDNGSTWLDLATGLTGTSYAWNTTHYADGFGYMIRVVVTDGIATSQDDSDDSFELDNFEETIPGGTLDPTLLIIIAAVGVVIIIIIFIFLKKKK